MSKIKSQNQEKVKKKNKQKKYLEFKKSFFYRLFHRSQDYYIMGPQSFSLNRRYFQKPIEILSYVSNNNFGFTNQILCQKNLHGNIDLFVPVFTSFKIKALQQLSLQNLAAVISGVLIITVLVKDLPPEIIELLKTEIVIIVNNSSGYKLSQQQNNTKITIKCYNDDYIRFYIRDNFSVSFMEDIFLSPFQLLHMVLSITFSSINVSTKKLTGLKNNYVIMFNCMRCSTQVPITFNRNVQLGHYGLCQKRIADYETNIPSFEEIISDFQEFIQGKSNAKEENNDEIKNFVLNILNKNLSNITKQSGSQIQLKPKQSSSSPLYSEREVDKFQHSHFIMPFRKEPLNSLLAIFIPMLMISTLSIFIYFEDSQDSKLGQVGSFVLAYIALIPTIKSVLPPSKHLTISQIIVYIQAVNSMLCLGNSYLYPSKKMVIWKNKLFLCSMFIHICCYGTIIILYLLHNFIWIKSYHKSITNRQPDCMQNRHLWNNPFADEYYLSYNDKFKSQQQLLIIPYTKGKFQQ